MKLKYKALIAVYIIGFWSMVGHERAFAVEGAIDPSIEAYFKAIFWPAVVLTRISTNLWKLAK